MKKITILLLLLFVGYNNLWAQAPENALEKVKDSIKTEVVNVVTSYAPKVTDAFKIKRKPVIKLSKNVEKKALDYSIITVPVASTFIPKSGVLKPINVGKRERLFDNYVSIGFGNNLTPYFEGYMHKNTRFESEYSINAKYTSTSNPIKNTDLKSSYHDIDVDLFYKKIGYYFDWKVGFTANRDKHHWYALPLDSGITFSEAVVNSIDPSQVYANYKMYGKLDFNDSYIKDSYLSFGYFSDRSNSNEVNADFNNAFSFPLGRFGINSEELQLGVYFNYLGGSFNRTYNDPTIGIDYSFITAGLHPYYHFNIANFDIKVGAKGYFSSDTTNSLSDFYIYPDASVSYPIIKKYANLYVGATGDLINNSYQSLSKANPYISPTSTIAQTNQTYNAFAGLKGIFAESINYNLKASYKDEKAKPFYVLNPSNSNGTFTTGANGFSFQGYEFGNSFNVIYDNVQTLSFVGEVEYDFSKQLSLGLNLEANTYNLENLDEAWHLPQLKGDLFGVYKTDKWYAGANIYFVGPRKGLVYQNNIANTTDLNSYVDLNLNGGYHFNAIFSAFIKANNLTNTNYQTFTNFNTQGIQIIAGVLWKFDALF